MARKRADPKSTSNSAQERQRMKPISPQFWTKFVPFFLVTSGIILTVSSLAKLVSAGHSSPYGYYQNDVFDFLTNRQVFVVASAAELMVVFLVVSSVSQILKLCALAWISSCFALYRIGEYFLDSVRPCPCWGNIPFWLHLEKGTPLLFTTIIATYLLLGSYSILLRELNHSQDLNKIACAR